MPSYEYCYSWIPRRCEQSGQWIWGLAICSLETYSSYDGIEVYTMVRRRWYSLEEGLIKLIKGI